MRNPFHLLFLPPRTLFFLPLQAFDTLCFTPRFAFFMFGLHFLNRRLAFRLYFHLLFLPPRFAFFLFGLHFLNRRLVFRLYFLLTCIVFGSPFFDLGIFLRDSSIPFGCLPLKLLFSLFFVRLLFFYIRFLIAQRLISCVFRKLYSRCRLISGTIHCLLGCVDRFLFQPPKKTLCGSTTDQNHNDGRDCEPLMHNDLL